MYMGNTTDIKAEEIGQHYVDLHKILGDKNVRVPHFVERWLGKLLHVDQINDTIYRNRHLFGLDFVYAFIEDHREGFGTPAGGRLSHGCRKSSPWRS